MSKPTRGQWIEHLENTKEEAEDSFKGKMLMVKEAEFLGITKGLSTHQDLAMRKRMLIWTPTLESTTIRIRVST